MSTPTTSSPPAATTSNNTNAGGAPASSPLLFFVALGFGVVFTNLWIIVGVKYCFRYNQRNRQMRAEENGDVDMATMPRPHRRRREKKLMTMDEVNERFPLTKYKDWRKSRESEGLPAAGGVTAPGSRTGSLRNVAAIVEPVDPESTSKKAKDEAVEAPQTTVGPSAHAADKRFSEASELEKGTTLPPGELKEAYAPVPDHLRKTNTATTSMVEEDEEDDHIHTAVPPELLTNPGDSCAICLDTLEEEDDVRGLTCGHAFHASCLDPWLTNRRACCPLCKADYFVPKPRPEGEEGNEERTGRRHGTGSRMPAAPANAWTVASGQHVLRTRMALPRRSNNATTTQPNERPGFFAGRRERREHRNQAQQDGEPSYTAGAEEPPRQTSPTRNWRSRFLGSRRTENTEQAPPTEQSYSADATPPVATEEPSEQPRRSRFTLPSRLRRQQQQPEAETPREVTATAT